MLHMQAYPPLARMPYTPDTQFIASCPRVSRSRCAPGGLRSTMTTWHNAHDGHASPLCVTLFTRSDPCGPNQPTKPPTQIAPIHHRVAIVAPRRL